MKDFLFYSLGVIVFTLVLLFAVFRTPSGVKTFWTKKENKKKVLGIKYFLAFGIFLALISTVANKSYGDELKGEWFAFGEAYLGADYTSMLSPMCFAGGDNDRITSHGGLRVNIYRTATKRVEINTKYTHHSCAFNTDRERYDSVGGELVIRLW